MVKESVREERKRFAAALTLRELAANAPTVFNVHVPHFIKAVWQLRSSLDVRLAVRVGFTSVFDGHRAKRRDIACNGIINCTKK